MSLENQRMEPTECAWEERVARAATHMLDEHVRAHLDECVRCREVVDAIHMLAEHGRAEVLRARERGPDVESLIALAGPDVFAPAARIRSWSPTLVEQVLRPVVWVERIAIALAAVAFLFILTWVDPHQSASALSVIGGAFEPTAAAAETDPATAVLTLTALVIIAIAAYGVTGLTGVRPHGTLVTPRSR